MTAGDTLSFSAITLHGVFLSIHQQGVLITGKSGIGKSLLALSLIQRGHVLIADDTPEFYKKNDKLIGKCPPLLKDMLHIKGAGVFNIRSLFSSSHIKNEQRLDMIIHLQKNISRKAKSELETNLKEKIILGNKIPIINFSVIPGHDFVTLIECLIQKEKLAKKQGCPAKELIARQNRMIGY